MTRFLLDTNILSHLVKKPDGPVATKISQVGEDSVYTSVIVAAELRYGCVKKGSERLTRQVEAILSVMQVLPLSAPVDRYYGRIRAKLEAIGKPIGANDLLIAAHAQSLDSVLVTDNVGEFRRVEDLKIENWLS